MWSHPRRCSAAPYTLAISASTRSLNPGTRVAPGSMLQRAGGRAGGSHDGHSQNEDGAALSVWPGPYTVSGAAGNQAALPGSRRRHHHCAFDAAAARLRLDTRWHNAHARGAQARPVQTQEPLTRSAGPGRRSTPTWRPRPLNTAPPGRMGPLHAAAQRRQPRCCSGGSSAWQMKRRAGLKGSAHSMPAPCRFVEAGAPRGGGDMQRI